MEKLFKINLLVLVILSLSTTFVYATIGNSDFDVHLYWGFDDPGLGDQTFKFNADGTFEMPDLGEKQGNWVEVPISLIPDELEINWFEAKWADTERAFNVWGVFFFTLLESDVPVGLKIITGSGELIIFDSSAGYYPFTFSAYSGFNFSDKFLQAVPDKGQQGDKNRDVTIFCSDTRFTEQVPCIVFENSGIKINGDSKAINDTSLRINISIEENAPLGKGNIIMNLSDGEMITAENAFEVLEKDQPEFLQAVPDSGRQGDEDKDITIFCSHVRFSNPCIAFENRGIRINSIEVRETSLVINIDIEEDARRGKGDIVINLSNGKMLIAKDAFEVKGVFLE